MRYAPSVNEVVHNMCFLPADPPLLIKEPMGLKIIIEERGR